MGHEVPALRFMFGFHSLPNTCTEIKCSSCPPLGLLHTDRALPASTSRSQDIPAAGVDVSESPSLDYPCHGNTEPECGAERVQPTWVLQKKVPTPMKDKGYLRFVFLAEGSQPQL